MSHLFDAPIENRPYTKFQSTTVNCEETKNIQVEKTFSRQLAAVLIIGRKLNI